jgi:hypothetical protein
MLDGANMYNAGRGLYMRSAYEMAGTPQENREL